MSAHLLLCAHCEHSFSRVFCQWVNMLLVFAVHLLFIYQTFSNLTDIGSRTWIKNKEFAFTIGCYGRGLNRLRISCKLSTSRHLVTCL